MAGDGNITGSGQCQSSVNGNIRAAVIAVVIGLQRSENLWGKKLLICFQGPIVPDVPGYQGTCTMVPQVSDVPHEPDLLHLRDPPEIGLERL